MISLWFGYKLEFSMTSSPWIRVFARTVPRTQNTSFTSFLYDKGYRWTSSLIDTEGKVLEGPESWSFHPCGGGGCYPPSTWLYSPAWQLTSPTVGFYGGFSSRHDWSLTPFPAPLPSLENGGGGYREGGAENVKLLIMAWFFWWLV